MILQNWNELNSTWQKCVWKVFELDITGRGQHGILFFWWFVINSTIFHHRCFYRMIQFSLCGFSIPNYSLVADPIDLIQHYTVIHNTYTTSPITAQPGSTREMTLFCQGTSVSFGTVTVTIAGQRTNERNELSCLTFNKLVRLKKYTPGSKKIKEDTNPVTQATLLTCINEWLSLCKLDPAAMRIQTK